MWINLIYWNKVQHWRQCLFSPPNTFSLACCLFFFKTHEEEIVITVLAVSTCILFVFFWKRWSWLSSWSPSPTSGSHWYQMFVLLLTSGWHTSGAPLQWNKSGKMLIVQSMELLPSFSHQLPQTNRKPRNISLMVAHLCNHVCLWR